MIARARRGADSERGAVAVIVAICAVVLFGMAAYAIDAGDAWRTRRNLITATDAAALAAAEKYAVGSDGCSTEPSIFVPANILEATVTRCAFTDLGDGAGYVTVDAEKTVDFKFAGVIGINSHDVASSTTAGFGLPQSLLGLRPLALCNQSDAFLTWVADGMPLNSSPYTIPYTKESPGDCGPNAPGNWGVLDLDGGSNSNRDTRDWLLNGYFGDFIDSDDVIPGDTGAFSNSLSTELNFLRTNHVVIDLPVYQAVSGNGSNARFTLYGFVGVTIIDFRTTGPEAGRYITVSFTQGVAQGRCCSHGPDFGLRTVFICAVTATFDSDNCRDR